VNTVLNNFLRPLPRLLLALAVVLALSAFRHTDIESHLDPDFAGYEFSTVVVKMPDVNLAFRKLVTERLDKQFRKNNIRMLMHNDLFPPTRQWSEDEIRDIYREHGVDAGLVITLGSYDKQSSPGMTLYDATTVNGITTGTATQVSFVSDFASFSAALVDTDSERTVWLGRVDTQGNGTLFVGNKSTAKGLVKGVLKAWKAAGVVVR